MSTTSLAPSAGTRHLMRLDSIRHGGLSAARVIAAMLVAAALIGVTACGSDRAAQQVEDRPSPPPAITIPSTADASPQPDESAAHRATASVTPAAVPAPTGTVTESATRATPDAEGGSVVADAGSAADGPIEVVYGEYDDNVAWLQLPDAANFPVPERGYPVVVLIHGGFWREPFDASLMTPLADDLTSRGFAAWNIEYRRVGGSGGWPQTGDDVVAAIDALDAVATEQPLDRALVVAVGHSAGGHLATWAVDKTADVTIMGAVGLGAVVDLAYFSESAALLGGAVTEVPDTYAAAQPVLDSERVILIQGGSDRIVPTESLAVAEQAGVRVVVVDGEDHFDVIDPTSQSWQAALDAIAEFMAQ